MEPLLPADVRPPLSVQEISYTTKNALNDKLHELFCEYGIGLTPPTDNKALKVKFKHFLLLSRKEELKKLYEQGVQRKVYFHHKMHSPLWKAIDIFIPITAYIKLDSIHNCTRHIDSYRSMRANYKTHPHIVRTDAYVDRVAQTNSRTGRVLLLELVLKVMFVSTLVVGLFLIPAMMAAPVAAVVGSLIAGLGLSILLQRIFLPAPPLKNVLPEHMNKLLIR